MLAQSSIAFSALAIFVCSYYLHFSPPVSSAREKPESFSLVINRSDKASARRRVGQKPEESHNASPAFETSFGEKSEESAQNGEKSEEADQKSLDRKGQVENLDYLPAPESFKVVKMHQSATVSGSQASVSQSVTPWHKEYSSVGAEWARDQKPVPVSFFHDTYTRFRDDKLTTRDYIISAIALAITIFASVMVYKKNKELQQNGQQAKCGFQSVLCCFCCTPVAMCFPIDPVFTEEEAKHNQQQAPGQQGM
eukprot:gnl/MRDRNA2_/MRDRNA2_56043_c0_seq1.p1 gnl/MRDRNA2_/MRDRNA2_56043_c0~~gnl/MRDRNA2_/MRDRNA2_56043_c0_seq1.p1  ORF type:complete len:273 (-),score=49.24 gnl/MRDRNA2_/MRDRNA2_56043_c0_seq1:46-801(-)